MTRTERLVKAANRYRSACLAHAEILVVGAVASPETAEQALRALDMLARQALHDLEEAALALDDRGANGGPAPASPNPTSPTGWRHPLVSELFQ